MPFTIKDKNEANEGRKDQKRSNRDDGVNRDVEFHLDIVISTFGGWRSRLEAPVAVHLTWQNVICTVTQKTQSKHKGSTVEILLQKL